MPLHGPFSQVLGTIIICMGVASAIRCVHQRVAEEFIRPQWVIKGRMNLLRPGLIPIITNLFTCKRLVGGVSQQCMRLWYQLWKSLDLVWSQAYQSTACTALTRAVEKFT